MSVVRRIIEDVRKDIAPPAPSPKPRHMRWLPIPLLFIATACLALNISGERPWSEFLGLGALIFSGCLAPRGPLRQANRLEPLDERETLLRTRAMLFGANCVVVLTLLGTFAFGNSNWLGIWTPTDYLDWRVTFYFLGTIYLLLPILHASWTTRQIDLEE